MLLRPTRPLPRKFNRPVSGATRKFVEQRQTRHKQYKKERWKRLARRSHNVLKGRVLALRRWLWVLVAVAALLGCGFLIFSPVMHVREIRVSRTDPRLDAERIQQVLKPLFGRHLFFLSDREVQSRVRGALPDVQDVSIEKEYPSQLVLTITLHPLIARLAIDLPPVAAEPAGQEVPQVQTYDYLTDNGLYVALPSAQSGVLLPTIRVIDWAAKPVPLTPLISPDFLKRMRDAETALSNQFGLAVTGRTVYVRAREFHLSTKAYTIWFDLSTPLIDQLQRYRTFLKTAPVSQVREYVDLRLIGRVIFR